jgi:clathrin heavy chain
MCYKFVRPDVALELSWRHGLLNNAMPFLIQYTSDMHSRLAELEKRTAPAEEEKDGTESASEYSAMLAGRLPQLGRTSLLSCLQCCLV